MKSSKSALTKFARRVTPEGRLAEILVLDQFSRNVWLDTPRAFAQDVREMGSGLAFWRVNP